MTFSSLLVCHRSRSISCCCNSLYCHVATLHEDVPACKALNCHINLLLAHPPSSRWNCHPGSPRSGWVDQIRRDNNLSLADLWRCAVIMLTAVGCYGLYWLSVDDYDFYCVQLLFDWTTFCN